MGYNSIYFLVWGWVAFIAFIAQFVLKHLLQNQYHYMVWLVVIPTVVINIYLSRRQKRTEGTITYIGEAMQNLWLGIGISFFVMSMVFVKYGWGGNVYPFFIIMYGLGTFVSGRILRFTPLVAGGIAAWALAITATYLSYDYQMLCGAGAILVSYIIPAYILRSKQTQAGK